MFRGKWVYLWLPETIFGGDVTKIIDELKRANIVGIAAKLHNGWSSTGYDTPTMIELRDACREEGIGFIGWGYIYLKYNAASEGRKAVEMINKYKPDAYLIDAEAEAKGQFVAAKVFTSWLESIPTPVGLSSYRYPSLHRELPWKELRVACDFDSPQVYYRNGDPIANLTRSKAEFDAMLLRLPYFPAGDMYFEHGIKPTPASVRAYLQACYDHPEIEGTLMWSMEQMTKCPELWNEFVTFDWAVKPVDPGYVVRLTQAERDAIISLAKKV